MEINLQGGIKLPQSLPGARSADLPVAVKTDSDIGSSAPTAGVEKKAESITTDMKREAAVQKAAQSYFKDVYAVSDTRFTIYKDTSGQYVTRYTSLRDGRVTYIPEPDMMQYLERRQAAREALLEITV
jgi:hypothetical protein